MFFCFFIVLSIRTHLVVRKFRLMLVKPFCCDSYTLFHLCDFLTTSILRWLYNSVNALKETLFLVLLTFTKKSNLKAIKIICIRINFIKSCSWNDEIGSFHIQHQDLLQTSLFIEPIKNIKIT